MKEFPVAVSCALAVHAFAACKIFESVWELAKKVKYLFETNTVERLTVSKYATWLLKLHDGLQRRYLDSLPKYM